MSIRCIAVFEAGRLRPTTPLALAEGAEVEVVIIPKEAACQAQSAAAVLAEIAALPMEPGGRDFAGRDHDKILYDSGITR